MRHTLILLAALMLAGAGLTASSASMTSANKNSSNVFTAGKLQLTAAYPSGQDISLDGIKTGETRTGVIRVTNTGDVPINTVSIYVGQAVPATTSASFTVKADACLLVLADTNSSCDAGSLAVGATKNITMTISYDATTGSGSKAVSIPFKAQGVS